jgi:small conductance mechanosensitive channel
MQSRRRVSATLIWACALLAPLHLSLAQPDPASQGEGQPTAEEVAKAMEAQREAAEQVQADREAQAAADQAASKAQQQAEAEIKAIARQYDTVVAPDAPLRKLQLMLRPMRRADLENEVEAWLALLQDKARELALKEYAAENAEEKTAEAAEAAQEPTGENAEGQAGQESPAAAEVAAEKEGRTQLLEEAVVLRNERNALVQRTKLVIATLKARGGETDEYTTYVAAVGDLIDDIDVTDTSAAWKAIKGWTVSDEGGIKLAKRTGAFLSITIIAWLLSRLLGSLASRGLRRFKNRSELLRDFLSGMVRRVTFWVGVVIALSQLGVNIGPLLAAIGAAGFVIGFALQGTLSNFASGLMILLYRPFDVGDAIDVAGVSGKVTTMTLVSTTICTFDNQKMIVPNNSIWGNVITNITGNNVRRVDMVFGIGYSDDADKARDILAKIVAEHDKVLAAPEPTIKLHELADSSVNFIVRPWAKTADYWDVYWDVTRQVKAIFDAEGLNIPFPQRDLHVPGEITVRVAT